MQIITHPPAKSLSPAFRTQSLSRNGIDRFKKQFALLHSRISNAGKESEEPINHLVTVVLFVKQADPKADTLALEAEIDKLVCGLYGLTEEEIKIVEGVRKRKAFSKVFPFCICTVSCMVGSKLVRTYIDIPRCGLLTRAECVRSLI